MGSDLYANSDLARTLYDTANEILGFDVKKVSFEGPEDKLKQTRVTQPAIFVHSVIAAHLLSGKNKRPDCVAGHSLGEYSALVAANALDFEDALKIVKRRGELMQSAGERNPGTMAAIVGLSAAKVADICQRAEMAGVVQPANYNSPQQIAISGSVAGVKKAMELAKEGGARRVIPLVVSGAFHSPLMEEAQAGLKDELDSADFRDAELPVYTNVMAEPAMEKTEIKDLLYKQLTHPVRWTELILNMISAGVDTFYEVGPGSVLTGLLKRIDRSISCEAIGTFEQIDAIV
jgi:[acyl-carrier-protein] S-malonyltransferase